MLKYPYRSLLLSAGPAQRYLTTLAGLPPPGPGSSRVQLPRCTEVSKRFSFDVIMPVTKLGAHSAALWNRRRRLKLAQRGRRPSDKLVGDRGGWLVRPPGVSSIRGRHVSDMKSETGEDKRGAGNVPALARAGGHVPEGAPAASEQREPVFAHAAR